MPAQVSSDPDVLNRIRAEFLEMPGLKLTPAQAQRLWNLNGSTCECLLLKLIDAKFLVRTPDGSFIRADLGRMTH